MSVKSDGAHQADVFDIGEAYNEFEAQCRRFCKTSDLDGLAGYLEKTPWEGFPTGLLYNNICESAQRNISVFAKNQKYKHFDYDYMAGYLYGVTAFDALASQKFHDRFKGGSFTSIWSFEYIKKLAFDPDVVFCLSCDKKYFDLFIDEVVTTFERGRADGVALNIHVDCPKEDLPAILAAFDKDWLSLTWSNLGYDKSAIHTVTRYLAASGLMEVYDADIVITDFDVHFVENFGTNILKVFKSRNINNIGGRPVKPPALPWQKYMASFQYLPNSESSRAFLKDYERVWSLLSVDGMETEWYIDQNILAYLFDELGYSVVGAWKLSGSIFQGAGTPRERQEIRSI